MYADGGERVSLGKWESRIGEGLSCWIIMTVERALSDPSTSAKTLGEIADNCPDLVAHMAHWGWGTRKAPMRARTIFRNCM
jgi:hypothetical protein